MSETPTPAQPAKVIEHHHIPGVAPEVADEAVGLAIEANRDLANNHYMSLSDEVEAMHRAEAKLQKVNQSIGRTTLEHADTTDDKSEPMVFSIMRSLDEGKYLQSPKPPKRKFRPFSR